jgi:hypothetical protein
MVLLESKLLSESAILRPESRSFFALSNNLWTWKGRAIVSHPGFSMQLIVEAVESTESRGSVSEAVDSVFIGPSVSKLPRTPQVRKGCRSGGIAGEAAAEGRAPDPHLNFRASPGDSNRKASPGNPDSTHAVEMKSTNGLVNNEPVKFEASQRTDEI